VSGEEELEVGEVGGRGELGVGLGVFEEGDGVVEALDGLGIVGDTELFLGDAGVSAVDEFAGEDLRGFHGPEAVTVEGFEAGVGAVFFDGVGHAMGENHGALAANDFVKCDELLGAHQRARTVMDKDVGDIGRECGEGGGDGVLALGPTLDEDARRGRMRGEREHLALVAVNDDIEIGDAAGGESGGAVGEDGPAREGREDFVGDGAGHARAAAGGEEDGGGAAHGWRGKR
jgi:hypothetical protein